MEQEGNYQKGRREKIKRAQRMPLEKKKID